MPAFDLGALESWNREHGAYLQLNEADLRWNLTGQNLMSYRPILLAGVPALFGVATAEGVKAGLSAKSIWLSYWGAIPTSHADAFVSEFLALAAREGKSRATFGADEFHFLPGIPLDSTSAELLAAARRAGFETKEECDFVGDIRSAAVQDYINTSGLKGGSWRFNPVDSKESQDRLHAFLSAEFPGRWTREFEFTRDRTDTARGLWMTLTRDTPEVIGFARHAIRGRVLPLAQGWTPGALRLPLHDQSPSTPDQNDGCLGPIGIAKSERGKGTGRVLLAATLKRLHENGAHRTCIDWTDALKYYEPLQFTIVRRFCCAWRVADTS
jgi:GNAT superfamily N-acetyltransferase